jgi:6-methylsalicylate decarboxylase
VAFDLHQHLWPEELLVGLGRRTEAPLLRREDTGWILELAGEPPAPVNLADHDPVSRALLAERDGVDRIAIAPSAPLGIEALAPEEAAPLLEAYHAGILELGAPFELWSATSHPQALGLCLPAGALASPEGLAAVAGELAALEARGAPLFVHPGAADPELHGPTGPCWWAAMTDYVAEMNAAWHGWAAWGRAAHPRLKVLFAMLAGGAPLHAERLAARGGPAEAVHDELTFFDVSSYGPRTIDAMVRVVGADRLVYGSDRPVVAPRCLEGLGPSLLHALTETNPARLLEPA